MKNYNLNPAPVVIRYSVLADGERLYDDQDYNGTTKIVEAEYAPNENYHGNPMVEAIPEPRNAHQIFLSCQKDLRLYDYQTMIQKPLSKKIEFLSTLRDLHYVLPMQTTLENAFYMALVNSYSHRTFLESKTKDVDIFIYNEKINTNRIMVGKADDSAFGGFSLIGPSGCGKSTDLRDMLSGVPQVIIHIHVDGSTSIQLLYIVVNCPVRSNFRALLQAIGCAIDRALGNTVPCYEKLLTVKPRDNLGVAYLQLRRIIEHLAIGMIILDEFQNIKLDSSVENSMNSLLFIGNETKCVFGVVGTRYSKEKLLNTLEDSLKSYRRLGVEIPAGNYCMDKTFVFSIIRWLFRYQLFEPRVNLPSQEDLDKEARGEIELTDEAKTGKALMEELYNSSKGIVDQIVSLFTFMNLDAIMKPANSTTVNADYVKGIAEKYFPSIRKILEKTDKLTQDEEEELKIQREEAMEQLQRLRQEQEICESNIIELHSEMEESANHNEDPADVIRDKAVETITIVAGTKYNSISIRKKVEAVMDSLAKKGQPIVLEDVISKASERLLRSRSDARPGYSPAKAEKPLKADKVDLDGFINASVCEI